MGLNNQWAAWTITLPSAVIYKSLKLQVYGRSTGVPGIRFGAQDTRQCSMSTSYSPSCVQSWTGVGYSLNWYSKTISPTYNRSGRTVHAFAIAEGQGVVSKARVTVTYGVLR